MAKIFTDLRGDHYQIGFILEDGTKKLVRIVPAYGMTPTRLAEQIRQIEESGWTGKMQRQGAAYVAGHKAAERGRAAKERYSQATKLPAGHPEREGRMDVASMDIGANAAEFKKQRKKAMNEALTTKSKVHEEEQLEEGDKGWIGDHEFSTKDGKKHIGSGTYQEAKRQAIKKLGTSNLKHRALADDPEERGREDVKEEKFRKRIKMCRESTFDKYPFLTTLVESGGLEPSEKDDEKYKAWGKKQKENREKNMAVGKKKAAERVRANLDEAYMDHDRFVYKDGKFYHNRYGGTQWKHGENGDHVHYDSDELHRALQNHLNSSGQAVTRKEAETHALHSSGITDHQQIVDALYSHEHPDERPEHKLAGVFATKIKRKLQAHDQIMAAKAKAPQ